jgi:cyclopropane-fatty-acyl-phospholipid synthase
MSHSTAQRHYIETIAGVHRLTNLKVITADINDFQLPPEATPDNRFDRVVSIEMFEHLRNYELLLARIASWLRPQGQLFVHIFCHRQWTYPFEVRGPADWMAQHFFTGGMMPGAGLLGSFPGNLQVVRQWHWSGMHYQRTAQAWLDNLDARRSEVLNIFQSVYGRGSAAIWLRRWRIFLLAVAELFSFNGGHEWMVSHNLMQHAPAQSWN